jgi:hypothetical protein
MKTPNLLRIATMALAFTVSANSQTQTPVLWDRTQIISQGTNFAITTADITETCWALSRGNTELFLPVHTCPKIAGMLFGERLAGIGIQYMLFKINRPWARKVSRLVPFAPYTGMYGSANGLVFSLRHLPKGSQ